MFKGEKTPKSLASVDESPLFSTNICFFFNYFQAFSKFNTIYFYKIKIKNNAQGFQI